MRYKTTRLKRFKIINTFLLILTSPIRLPLIILMAIGEISTNIIDLFDDSVLCSTMESIVKKFKFDEIVDKQYEINKDKFKY